MSILTAQAILFEMSMDRIVIDPFDQKRLNPNSINLRLAPTLLTYSEVVLDPKIKNYTIPVPIPDEGFILEPGRLYLGQTYEYTETHRHVPLIDGRSSMGRLGVFVHVTAGFGDIGFCGYWTLEMMCIHPVRIYPFMEICQISYHVPSGPIVQTYKGKYQNNKGVQPCMLYAEAKIPPQR